MEKSEDITLEEKPSLGKSLSWARTRKELSQQDVADELNLGKDIINALENDEPIEGVSPTYIRGYQRAYIRFLELDESEFQIDNSTTTQFKGTHENLQVIDKNMSMRGSSGGISFPVKLFLPLLLIGLAVIYWPQISSIFNKDESEQITQAATVKQETDTAVIQTFEIKPVSIEESIATAVDRAKESIAENEAENTQTTAETETVAHDLDQVTVAKVVDSTQLTPDEVKNTQSDQENSDESQLQETELASVNPQARETKITFVATGESWLEIKDAQDTRLYRNTLKLDRITVSGELPLKIRAGNLQALRVMSFQGEQKKVDIFDDSTTVANFYIEKDQAGRLIFTTQ